ncbi:hypothetical protein SESBI_42217 [Sesbania bispinosa]|nr:hypothetical protein SESBI_42217 [Sesbania bispinosa]
MASSNQDGNSETEPPPTTTKHVNPITPPSTATYPTHPPYPMCYPPAGYPPVPGGQNPQGYYPYTNGYHHYPPSVPYYGPTPTHNPSSAATRFYRSFILCTCILLTCLFLASLFMALMLRPELPLYKVVYMSVSNFTTTPALSGEWDTKVAIRNANNKLKVYFSEFKVDVMYKDGVVSVNYLPGFMLSEDEARETEAKSWSSNANGAVIGTTTLDDMVKERNTTGSLTFDLRVSSVNAFKSGSFSTKYAEVVAICEGLKVVFQNNSTANGTLENNKPLECQVYV